MLKIGRIPFLVCAPFFQNFDESECRYSFIEGSPKELNDCLSSGTIDAAPSSSFEYARNPEKYRISSQFCTSCSMEVRSVCLFSKYPINELENKSILLTNQSETSVNLLKILFKKHFKISVNYLDEVKNVKVEHDAVLYIGDEALEEASKANYAYSYDLGGLWKKWQGMPFVFGAWMVREEVFVNPALRLDLENFMRDLEQNIYKFYDNLAEQVDLWCIKYPVSIPFNQIESYYKVLDYQMTPLRQKSLKLFFDLAAECNLIDNKVEEIKYF